MAMDIGYDQASKKADQSKFQAFSVSGVQGDPSVQTMVWNMPTTVTTTGSLTKQMIDDAAKAINDNFSSFVDYQHKIIMDAYKVPQEFLGLSHRYQEKPKPLGTCQIPGCNCGAPKNT